MPEDFDYEATNEFFEEDESDHELGKVIDTKSSFCMIALSFGSLFFLWGGGRGGSLYLLGLWDYIKRRTRLNKNSLAFAKAYSLYYLVSITLDLGPISKAAIVEDVFMIENESISKAFFEVKLKNGEKWADYLVHVIEQPIFRIPNLEYLQQIFVYLLNQQ